MATDITFQAPLSPIQRSPPDQRVANFTAQSDSIYNKYSVYDNQGGDIGFRQPFIYTKITDSTVSKNLTAHDNQAFPIGSTIRDVERVTKFMGSGTGVLFIGKQLLLQNTNAFNETRVYNPLSVIKAAAKPGSLGLIDYPPRHVETSGGLLNYFANALLDTIGIQASTLNQARIDGTAIADFSKYAAVKGDAKYGLMRFETANAARTKFSTIWANNTSQNAGGGFLANLGSALLDRLAAMIPSTNPFRSGNSSSQLVWKYRVEYPTTEAGIYHSFINTNSELLTEASSGIPHIMFYNDTPTSYVTGTTGVKQFHRYYPSETSIQDKTKWYASSTKIPNENIGVPTNEDGSIPVNNTTTGYTNTLKSIYERMVGAIDVYNNDTTPQFAKSAERYDTNSGSYLDIPGNGASDGSTRSGATAYYSSLLRDAITVDKTGGQTNRGFAIAKVNESSGANADEINKLGALSGNRNDEPPELLSTAVDQSKDIIFFYFYDLVNMVYVPFRATIHGLNEQHSAEWEDIKYMGRADKLFIYKGFTRDVNVNFRVYANSAYELVPMWERISYLVGLTRPSDYTTRAIVTNASTVINRNEINAQLSNTTDQESRNILQESMADLVSTGRESRFIYPPMITFRIGDLYVDQPAIITSVNTTIPDETNWESFRGKDYKYLYGVNKTFTMTNAKSRQLPLQADISMQMRLLEKKQSLVSNPHYGMENASTGVWWQL